jgi:hypothetical protein
MPNLLSWRPLVVLPSGAFIPAGMKVVDPEDIDDGPSYADLTDPAFAEPPGTMDPSLGVEAMVEQHARMARQAAAAAARTRRVVHLYSRIQGRAARAGGNGRVRGGRRSAAAGAGGGDSEPPSSSADDPPPPARTLVRGRPPYIDLRASGAGVVYA